MQSVCRSPPPPSLPSPSFERRMAQFSALLCVRDFLLFGLLSFGSGYLCWHCFVVCYYIIPQSFEFMFIYPKPRSTFTLKHSHISRSHTPVLFSGLANLVKCLPACIYIYVCIYVNAKKKVTKHNDCLEPIISIASRSHIRYNLYSTTNHQNKNKCVQ